MITGKVKIGAKSGIMINNIKNSPINRPGLRNEQMHHNNQLAQSIESDWAKLEASLAGLNEQQLTQICDEHGWNIKDHLAHIAHWEEVLFMMFLGISYEESMRIPWGKYAVFDDVNEDMRRQWADFSPTAIVNRLRRVHAQLMTKLSPLLEEDLHTPVKLFFSNVWLPDYEQRDLAAFIQAHTDNHYRDHTAWIGQMRASAG
jgi:hypothetical protein